MKRIALYLALVLSLPGCQKPAPEPPPKADDEPTITVPDLGHFFENSKANAAAAQLSAFHIQLQIFQIDTGRLPTEDEGLDALHVQPPGLTNWGGPYALKEIPVDPWERAYVFARDGESYSIRSTGPDGKQNTPDDIVMTP